MTEKTIEPVNSILAQEPVVEPAPVEVVEAVETVAPVASEPTQVVFKDSLPDAFKEDKAFDKFNSLGDMAKSYKELSSLIGKKTTDLSEEELVSLDKTFGVPEEASGYELLQDEDNVIDSEALANTLKDLKIPKKLAPGIADYFKKALLEGNKLKEEDSIETIRSQQEDTITLLKQEFGLDFDKKANLARTAIKHEPNGDQLMEKLDKAGLGNDVDIIKMFIKKGESLIEDKIIGKDVGVFGISPSEAPQKIAEFRKEHHKALNSNSDPRHDWAIEELNKLYRI